MSEDKQSMQAQDSCLACEHISETVMSGYIHNHLSASEREQVELRMEACEGCLELFMLKLEAVDAAAPVDMAIQAAEAGYVDANSVEELTLPDMKQLEDRVIMALRQEQQKPIASAEKPESAPVSVSSTSRRRPHLLQHPAAQYAIAASITLLLLGSGSFSSFSQRLAAHDQEAARAEAKPEAIQTYDPAKMQEWSSPTWSERMVDQTSSWLDGLQSLRYK